MLNPVRNSSYFSGDLGAGSYVAPGPETSMGEGWKTPSRRNFGYLTFPRIEKLGF